MHPLKKQARIAGLLYLLVVITGPFVLIYAPSKLYVAGDATATVSNILAHESFFRAYMAVGVISELAFIFAVLALYELLKDVGRQLALAMAFLILVLAPLSFMEVAQEFAMLNVARDSALLSAFDKPQRDALTALMVSFDRQGVIIYMVFWGLWLLPLGILVYRSGFLPRVLGAWLFINGMAYVVISATGLLLPQFYSAVRNGSTPILLGEVALALYLSIVGVRERSTAVAVAPAG